jgi:CheY-like chemotaxis protein
MDMPATRAIGIPWFAVRMNEMSDSPRETPPAQLRVLIAEDDALNRVVVSRMVELFGYEVVVAVDGREALETFCAAPFDLVLMDANMPRMNGVEALQGIRAWELGQGSARVPVIALTGESAEAQRDVLLAAGFAAFLAKPFRVEELKAAIANALPSANAPQADT